MPTPVRFTSGFTQDAPWQTLAQSGFPNPFFYHLFAEDFDIFDPDAWTTTLVGTGTNAVTAADGGAVLLTTTAGASDSVLNQLKAASFKLTAGKKAFFMVRFQLDNATLSKFHAGLIATSTTPLAATDGLYFRKDSGAATVLLRNSASSTNTDLALSGVGGTVTAATNLDLGFYVDSKGQVCAFVGSAPGYIPQSGTGSSVPPRGAVACFTPAALSSSTLNVSFGLTNTTAVARTATVDFILAAVER